MGIPVAGEESAAAGIFVLSDVLQIIAKLQKKAKSEVKHKIFFCQGKIDQKTVDEYG